MSDMDELLAFLRRCLDEDERVALAASPDRGTWVLNGEGDIREDGGGYVAVGPWGGALDVDAAAHILRWQPTSMLDEVKAKRRVLDEITLRLDPTGDDGGWTSIEFETGGLAEATVRVLAQPYAGREGWNEAWRV